MSVYAQFFIAGYADTTYQTIVFENLTPGSTVRPSVSLAGTILNTARILAVASHALASAR
jgi:hypothetical protein